MREGVICFLENMEEVDLGDSRPNGIHIVTKHFLNVDGKVVCLTHFLLLTRIFDVINKRYFKQ